MDTQFLSQPLTGGQQSDQVPCLEQTTYMPLSTPAALNTTAASQLHHGVPYGMAETTSAPQLSYISNFPRSSSAAATSSFYQLSHGDGRIHLPYTALPNPAQAVDMSHRQSDTVTPAVTSSRSNLFGLHNLSSPKLDLARLPDYSSHVGASSQNGLPVTLTVCGASDSRKNDSCLNLISLTSNISAASSDQNNVALHLFQLTDQSNNSPLLKNQGTSINTKMEKMCPEKEVNLKYTCGACLKTVTSICQLHHHIKTHGSDLSYFFNQSNLTAYPRFEVCSQVTQTGSDFLDSLVTSTQVQKDLKRNRLKRKRAVENCTKAKQLDLVTSKVRCNTDLFTVDKESNNLSANLNQSRDISVNNAVTSIEDKGECNDNLEQELDDFNYDTDDYIPEEKLNLKKKHASKKQAKTPDSVKKESQVCRKAKERQKQKGKYTSLAASKLTMELSQSAHAKVKTKRAVCVNEKVKSVKGKEWSNSRRDRGKRKPRTKGAKFQKKTERKKIVATQKVKGLASNGSNKLSCVICDIPFQKVIHLRIHIRSTHSDVPHICSMCSLNFNNEQELAEHRRSVHHRGNHQCELCGRILSTKGMLEGHYLVHKGIKPFSCDICEPKRTFTRKSQLKAHLETHSDVKTLQCEFCGKPFNARYLMLNHVKHCSGDKPYKCQFCDMGFVSNHSLQRHKRTHTGEKPFVCEVCAFASSNASCLARHMRTHTGEKPFACEYCQQTFAAPGALRKHVRVHTLEKPYKCSYCSKAFTQRWNLKTHERQHTGETPYKCQICGTGYKQNVLLKAHMKTHYEDHEQSANTGNQPGQLPTLNTPQNKSGHHPSVNHSTVIPHMNLSNSMQGSQSMMTSQNSKIMDAQSNIQSHSLTTTKLTASLLKPHQDVNSNDHLAIISQAQQPNLQHSAQVTNQLLVPSLGNSMYPPLS